jgi:hypothetical protein
VLRLTLPKSEAAKPRQIKVSGTPQAPVQAQVAHDKGKK